MMIYGVFMTMVKYIIIYIYILYMYIIYYLVVDILVFMPPIEVTYLCFLWAMYSAFGHLGPIEMPKKCFL